MSDQKLKQENEQLRLKLNYFQEMTKYFHEKAERGELALKRIQASPLELAHRIAEEELKELNKLNMKGTINNG